MPLDFSSGAVWTFWSGIAVAILGVVIAVGGYIADQQTSAKIQGVSDEAQRRIDAAEKRAGDLERKLSDVAAAAPKVRRHLSDEQRAALNDAAARSINVRIGMQNPLGDDEAFTYREEIHDALLSPHTTFNPNDISQAVYTSPPSPLEVGFIAGDVRTAPIVEAFKKHFAGVRLVPQSHPDAAGQILITVGPSR